MSIYTNDIDAPRQAIESIPSTLILSDYHPWGGNDYHADGWSTLVLDCSSSWLSSWSLSSRMFLAESGRAFGAQQRTWGLRTAFIEEMMSGQKWSRPLCMTEH